MKRLLLAILLCLSFVGCSVLQPRYSIGDCGLDKGTRFKVTKLLKHNTYEVEVYSATIFTRSIHIGHLKTQYNPDILVDCSMFDNWLKPE